MIPESKMTIDLKDVRRPNELFNKEIHGLVDALSSRYARDMVLRCMLNGMSTSSSSSTSAAFDSMTGESKQETNRKETKETMSKSNTNLEQLSKLLKLVAANEGVLEGKSSDVMDSLVRAIQRTIDMNEQTNSSGNNDLANLIVNDCVAHIQGATIPSDDEMEVRESLHPCYPGSKYEGKPIIFPNARAIRI
jgi:hypothetical protein